MWQFELAPDAYDAFAVARSVVPTQSHGVASAAAVHERIKELSAVAADHLAHEEAELEPVFWDKRDTPQMKQMGRKFSRDVGIAQAGSFFAWLQDGATPEENAALRANVPAPVVTILTTVRGGNYRRTIAPIWRAA